MVTFSHGNALPWLIDPGYLLRLVELSILTVVVMFVAGLAYAGIYHLLSNRTDHGSSTCESTASLRNVTDLQAGLNRSQASNEVLKEGYYNET